MDRRARTPFSLRMASRVARTAATRKQGPSQPIFLSEKRSRTRPRRQGRRPHLTSPFAPKAPSASDHVSLEPPLPASRPLANQLSPPGPPANQRAAPRERGGAPLEEAREERANEVLGGWAGRSPQGRRHFVGGQRRHFVGGKAGAGRRGRAGGGERDRC